MGCRVGLENKTNSALIGVEVEAEAELGNEKRVEG